MTIRLIVEPVSVELVVAVLPAFQIRHLALTLDIHGRTSYCTGRRLESLPIEFSLGCIAFERILLSYRPAPSFFWEEIPAHPLGKIMFFKLKNNRRPLSCRRSLDFNRRKLVTAGCLVYFPYVVYPNFQGLFQMPSFQDLKRSFSCGRGAESRDQSTDSRASH